MDGTETHSEKKHISKIFKWFKWFKHSNGKSMIRTFIWLTKATSTMEVSWWLSHKQWRFSSWDCAKLLSSVVLRVRSQSNEQVCSKSSPPGPPAPFGRIRALWLIKSVICVICCSELLAPTWSEAQHARCLSTLIFNFNFQSHWIQPISSLDVNVFWMPFDLRVCCPAVSRQSLYLIKAIGLSTGWCPIFSLML